MANAHFLVLSVNPNIFNRSNTFFNLIICISQFSPGIIKSSTNEAKSIYLRPVVAKSIALVKAAVETLVPKGTYFYSYNLPEGVTKPVYL